MDLRQQLKDMEGCVPCAYQDSLGFWTIGVGRLIDKRKGGGLSPEEIDFLMDNDIKKVRAQVFVRFPWTANLDEARNAALINMAFQLGIDGLAGFVNTLAAIRDGHYDHAAEQMLQSKWATQTPERARRLSRQIATGSWQ